MTYAASSLSSFASSSTSSASSANASSLSSTDKNETAMKKLWEKTPKDQVGLIASFLPKRAQILGNTKNFKDLLRTEYSKTLELFKAKIGEPNFSGIKATAISDLKRVISKKEPNALKKLSDNKTLLTKRIFCNLFEKIKLMNGDGFLRNLFPNEDITSASNLIDYTIDPNVLEKMHQWLEDINLITMMKSVARQEAQVSQSLEAQELLGDIDSASLDAVHARAQNFRAWINGNNNIITIITVLDFNNLGLTSLPPEIDRFIRLRELSLINNQLTELPASLGNLGQLQWLYLDHNRLTELPASLGNLGQLQWLYLINNQLTELPASLGNLGQLQWLYLDHNRLTELPASFGKLGQLHYLFLENNQLTLLPTSFGKLVNLQGLNLSNNHLTELPASFGNLGQLQWLYLYDNPLLQLPLPNMTNLSEAVRKEIWKHSSLKARISYYLAPYLPKKETVIAAVASVAWGYLIYNYFSTND